MSFQSLFSPQGVIVSGSMAPGKLGNRIVSRLVDGGMTNVYALNPKAQGVGDIPGFASAQEIGKPIDLLIVVSPAPHVPGVLEDCGKAGVKSAIIISSGFGEAGHPELEEAVKKAAHKYGIRYTGPNCAGLVNTHTSLYATIESVPPKGKTALVSQSGAVGGSIMGWAAEQGLGFSKFVSYGNAGDLSELEFLNYLKDDEETSVIAMYVENIKDGRNFMQVMREVTAKKPVVIIKSGRTSIGQRATLSHTGSMSGADAVYDAALKECGALRVESIEEMFDLCKGLVDLPLMEDNRLLIVTNSGGPGVMAADKGELCHLQLAEPSDAVKEDLKSFLPAHASIRNPIDLTVEGTAEEYEKSIVSGIKDYDAAIALYIGTPYLESKEVAEGVIRAYESCKKPVLGIFQVGRDIEESKALLKEAGLPAYLSGERAAWTLSRMLEYKNYRAKNRTLTQEAAPKGRLQGDSKALLEPEAMELLRDNGVNVLPFRFVRERRDILKACQEIGYPVVVKVVSPDIIHKSDFGGVKVNISGDEAALVAFDHMEEISRGLDFRGVAVYPMAGPGVEVILGLNRDVQFGPVIVFGLGGIYSEVLKDIAIRVAPVSREEALEMIESIRAYPILKGIRGQKGVDLEGLAQMISNLSQLPFLYPDIAEVDLNPVFASAGGCVAADVRIITLH